MIGTNIKKLREKVGMTQLELGEKIGVNQSMIAQIERGTKIPNVLLAKQMSKVLHCDVNDLLRGVRQ